MCDQGENYNLSVIEMEGWRDAALKWRDAAMGVIEMEGCSFEMEGCSYWNDRDQSRGSFTVKE